NWRAPCDDEEQRKREEAGDTHGPVGRFRARRRRDVGGELTDSIRHDRRHEHVAGVQQHGAIDLKASLVGLLVDQNKSVPGNGDRGSRFKDDNICSCQRRSLLAGVPTFAMRSASVGAMSHDMTNRTGVITTSQSHMTRPSVSASLRGRAYARPTVRQNGSLAGMVVMVWVTAHPIVEMEVASP